MNRRFISSHFFQLLLLSVFLLVVACGDEDGGDTNITIDRDDEQQQEEEGTYTSRPSVVINNRITTNIKIITNVNIDNDDVDVKVDCTNAPKNVIHQQFIHIGVRCPTLDDDLNGDGYVDWVETQQVVGPELLALDGNLESPDVQNFPFGTNYTYQENASLAQIQEGLPSGEELSLDGRVLVIYGSDPSTPLPSTVATSPDDPVNVTIPISCVVLNKLDSGSGGTTGGGTTGGGTTGGGTTGGGTTGGGATGGGTTGGGTTGGGTTGGGTTGSI